MRDRDQTTRWPRARCALYCLTLLVAAGVGGCSSGRDITISVRPDDATITINNLDRGRGPLTEHFEFGDRQVYKVTASRYGFKEETVQFDRNFPGNRLDFNLKPRTRKVTIYVTPVAARVSVNGKSLSADPVSQITTDLEFRVDPKQSDPLKAWIPHTVSAEAPGYRKTDLAVSWTDQKQGYTIDMPSLRKDVQIVTVPPGAEVFIDGVSHGISPLTYNNFEVKIDPATGHYAPKKVRAVKAGYAPVETTIGGPEERGEYVLELPAMSKAVRIVTKPAGATVKIDDIELQRDATGASIGALQFPPAAGTDKPRTYRAVASKPDEPGVWSLKSFDIGWDKGRAEYLVELSEIKTQPVELLRAAITREDAGWRVQTQRLTTTALRDPSEPGNAAAVSRVTPERHVARGTVIDTLATSPDGARIVFTVLGITPGGGLRSQLFVIGDDGNGLRAVGDGKDLDLTPTFSPDGEHLLFSSTRGGGGGNASRPTIWSMPLDGEGPAVALTAALGGDSADLWPSQDSLPKPRLFYEAHVDGRSEPRLFAAQLRTALRTDLQQPGHQPRVSPKADRVLLASANPQTGKRDLCTIPDEGGPLTFLTTTPDYDEFDAVWSKDGRQIAFVSDRPVPKAAPATNPAAAATAPADDLTGKPGDYNVWVMDVAKPDAAVPVTANGSWDDCPAWDLTGNAVYFRSNRGGEWGIWKAELK